MRKAKEKGYQMINASMQVSGAHNAGTKLQEVSFAKDSANYANQ